MTPRDRIQKIRDLMLSDLVEREVPIRLALLSALAGEHLLLVGPPGTAKSLVSRRLHLAFADAPYFERLLTRFTVPEEIFGPLSVKALENDRYERLTDRYLPTASIAFLDEIFKANSAILNALLTLLNEREFDNGTKRVEAPLIAVVGASNELPKEKELEALFDRFLLRLHVGPVSKEGFEQLLTLRGQPTPSVPDDLKLTREDLRAFQDAAEKVTLPPEIVEMLGQLREFCLANKLPVSDRRWRKVVKLLQTSACTNGRESVNIWDCWLLQHCLWNSPEDREKIHKWYEERVGATKTTDPAELLQIVTTWEAVLARDKASKSQKMDEHGNLLFKGAGGKLVTQNRGSTQMQRDGEDLFIQSKELQDAAYRHGFQRNRYNADDERKGYTRQEIESLPAFERLPSALRAGYFDHPANMLMGEGSLPPAIGPTVHKAAHIKDCLANLDEVAGEIAEYREELQDHLGKLEQEIRTHLWVTDDFLTPAQRSLNTTLDTVKSLEDRLAKLVEGYRSLPQEKKTLGKA